MMNYKEDSAGETYPYQPRVDTLLLTIKVGQREMRKWNNERKRKKKKNGKERKKGNGEIRSTTTSRSSFHIYFKIAQPCARKIKETKFEISHHFVILF